MGISIPVAASSKAPRQIGWSALRLVALPAIVLFVNVMARNAYIQVLLPQVSLDSLWFHRAPFFNAFMAAYSAMLCIVFVAIPDRVILRALSSFGVHTWSVDRGLWLPLSFGLLILCYGCVSLCTPFVQGVFTYFRAITPSSCQSFTVLNALVTGWTTADNWIQLGAPSEASTASWLAAWSLLLGIVLWLAQRYYSMKAKPLIKWRAEDVRWLEWLLRLLTPAGTILLVVLFLIVAPTVYGTDRGEYELQLRQTASGSHHVLEIVTSSPVTSLAAHEIGPCNLSTATHRYGVQPNSGEFLFLAAETSDSYFVTLADATGVRRWVSLPKSVVVELRRYSSTP